MISIFASAGVRIYYLVLFSTETLENVAADTRALFSVPYL